MRFISFLFFQTRELIFIGANYLFSTYICSNLIFSCSTLKELSFSFFFRVLCLFRFSTTLLDAQLAYLSALFIHFRSLSAFFVNFDDFDAYDFSVNFWRTAQITHSVILVVDFGLNSFWKNFGHFFRDADFFVSLICPNCFFLGSSRFSNDANHFAIFTHACTRINAHNCLYDA